MALDITRFIGRFVDEARDHLRQIDEAVTALEDGSGDVESVNTLFRSAHTIKGSSRMLKLDAITETAHRVEDVLAALRDGSLAFTPDLGRLLRRAADTLAGQVDGISGGGEIPPCDPGLIAALAGILKPEAALEAAPAQAADIAADPQAAAAPVLKLSPLQSGETVRVQLSKLDELIKLMGEVVTSHVRLRERLADLHRLERKFGPGLRAFKRDLKDDVLVQELLMEELHGKALIMRMLPLSIVLEPAARMVRQLGRSLGKEVDCVTGGMEIELDRQMLDRLADPIGHLLRNAADHGIEAPDARAAAGKPRHGTLRLQARQDGGWVVVEIADDGGGIDVARIRDKAVRRGTMSAEHAANLGDREAIDLIFEPGFSTASIITDISGRGVGLDVVKRTVVDELQGVIGVETIPGRGTTFTLRLPLSLAVMRVLLVRVGDRNFGFTAQQVVQLLQIPASRIIQAAGRNALVIQNELVPIADLGELVEIGGKPARTPEQKLLLLVVQVGGEKLALRIDDLIDERDMVIKPLPDHLRHLSLVAGMVMTGRNELVSVLHASALLDAARRARGEAVRSAETSEVAAKRILVVDDSLNTREIEKDVLEAHGYAVTLAEDGLDGLRQTRSTIFDAVLTDVEMPNMDGFTLTASLRQDERYRNIPIIIITSREKEEDKRRGIEVGADAYIVKGSFDQNNLVDTLRSLLG